MLVIKSTCCKAMEAPMRKLEYIIRDTQEMIGDLIVPAIVCTFLATVIVSFVGILLYIFPQMFVESCKCCCCK